MRSADFGGLCHIGREIEVADAHDLAVAPVEQDEIGRCRRVVLVRQHRRPAIDTADGEPPTVPVAVFGEILAHEGLADEGLAGDEVEARILGQHVAHSVEIACVEKFDIAFKARLFLPIQRRFLVFGRILKRCQPRPAPVQDALMAGTVVPMMSPISRSE